MIIGHLITNGKFIDFFYNLLKSIDNTEHRFFVLKENIEAQIDSESQLDCIKLTPIYATIERKKFYTNFLSTKKLLNECDSIVIHFMSPFALLITLLIEKKKPIVWSGWGADYYYLLNNRENFLFFSKTQEINKNLYENSKKKKIKLLIIIRNFTLIKLLIPLILKKVRFFSSPIPNDFHKLKKYLPNFNPEYLQINYGSLEKTFLIGSRDFLGSNILIGNSVSLTNNHIDAFETLSRIDIGNRKVIVPLSYGDNDERYKNIVLYEGRKYFNDNFQPLTKFTNLEAYNTIISSCAIAIMNHKRQQAIGNIGVLLFSGTKLYLHEENPVYDFFKSRGAHIYKTSELTPSNSQVFSPLTEAEIKKNRCVLAEFWGEDVIKRNIINLIDRLRAFENI